MYSISKFSKLSGISKTTLRRWDNSGELVAIKIGSRNDRRYTNDHLAKIKGQTVDTSDKKLNVIYVRESTKMQKVSLEAQIERCKLFCLNAGIQVSEVIQDFGSALNYNREGLNRLIMMIHQKQINKLIKHIS